MLQTERRWAWLTTGLLLAYAVVGLAIVDQYGITYDESVHSMHGQNVLAWYLSGFTDRTFTTFSNLHFYGALFDLPPVIVARATGADLWAIRHVYALGFAVLTAAGIGRLAAHLNGEAAGFWATLAIILTPRFFGHGFNNGKDIPMAACTVWTIVAAVSVAERLPHPGWRRIIGLGFWLGLALAIRMSALSVVGALGLTVVAWWATAVPRPPVWPAVKNLVPIVIAVGAVAAVVMLPFWPYLQIDPIRGGMVVIREQWRGAGYGLLPVLYDGRVINYLDVPRTYVWAWLTRITPEYYAVGLVLACVAAYRQRPWPRHSVIGWTAVISAASLPLLLATLTRPALYDGLRHFLFATVLLAVPAGAGMAWCVRASGWRLLRMSGIVLFALSAVLTSADMIRIHPYQSTFFNRSVAAGLAGAAGRWDTDYWGSALREGTLWLVDNVKVPSGQPRPRVASSATMPQSRHYLPAERFDYIGSVDDPPLKLDPYANPPDFYLGITRWDHDRFYPGEVIHRVARDGVTLLVVVRVDRHAASRLTLGDRPGQP